MLCGSTPFAGGHPLAVSGTADQPPPPIPAFRRRSGLSPGAGQGPGSRPASAAEAHAALAPLETALASWPALAPWEGPAAEASAWAPPPAGQTVAPGPAGAAPQATILRHRDHGSVPGPNGTGGFVPPPAASGGLRARLAQAPPGRRRRLRVTALAVALVAVFGLATTVSHGRDPPVGRGPPDGRREPELAEAPIVCDQRPGLGPADGDSDIAVGPDVQPSRSPPRRPPRRCPR